MAVEVGLSITGGALGRLMKLWKTEWKSCVIFTNPESPWNLIEPEGSYVTRGGVSGQLQEKGNLSTT